MSNEVSIRLSAPVRRRHPRWVNKSSGVAAAVILAIATEDAAADPGRGEVRSIQRDADRIYSVVAGEADATAVVQNPANLGYLNGRSGILDVSYQARSREMRGSGGGLFLAGPLWRDRIGIGAGLQMLDPRQLDDGDGVGGVELGDADLPYSKLSLGMAVSLARHLPGVSLGFGYSRLFSRENGYAYQVDLIDAGLTWRAGRWLALGIVGHGLNQPRVGLFSSSGAADGQHSLPLAVEVEAALRPLGSSRLELAVGARSDVKPWQAQHYSRFAPGRSVHGRVQVRFDGLHLYGQVRSLQYMDQPLPATPTLGMTLSAGIMLEFDHLGLAAGPMLRAAGDGSPMLASGVAGRVRVSDEAYTHTLRKSSREVVRLPLAAYAGEREVAQLVRRIDSLRDRGHEYILVETRGSPHNYAQLEEIREALLRFRGDGGRVVAYLEGGGLSAYFLASAADRIVAHPERALDLVGISSHTFYFGDVLRKFGAQAELVRVAEYKGSPEQFSNNTASPAVAHQRSLYHTDVWNHVLRVIERERGRNFATITQWIDTAPHAPDEAVALGIVDATAYPDELDAHLEAWLDRPVRIERPHDDPVRADDFGRQPEVAVLYIEGPINGGRSYDVPALGVHVVGGSSVTSQIKALRKDRYVKAVVVRLDTTGGMMGAGEAIARELEHLAAVKPVVISMGNQTTSAGYLIASAGDYIYADATTQTGSIGVFWFSLNLSGLLDKLGIGVDVESFGRHAGWSSMWQPQSDADRAVAQAFIQRQYDRFVERVAAARSMSIETVDNVARGRIWSGVRAIDNGLVDAYGGLREATMRARRMAGLRDDGGVVVDYPPEPTLVEQLEDVRRLPALIPGVSGRAAAALPWQDSAAEMSLLYWALTGGGALAVALDGVVLE